MERKIIEYPKQYFGQESAAQKWGVPKLPANQRQKRMVLITGCGRSGTMHTARMFESIGLDVKHEVTGLDGTASLFFAVDSDWYPMLPWLPYDGTQKCHVGERRSDYEFEHVLHITRHPLVTIPSISVIFPTLNYEFFMENNIIPDVRKMPRLLRSAHTWYGLNKVVEEQAEFRFQLEQYEKQWPKICKLLKMDFTPFPKLPPTNRGTGFRKADPTTWNTLEHLDRTLAVNIRTMATRYGYV